MKGAKTHSVRFISVSVQFSARFFFLSFWFSVCKPTLRWKPPNPGWLKISLDGTYDGASQTVGVGVVVRDDHPFVVDQSCYGVL